MWPSQRFWRRWVCRDGWKHSLMPGTHRHHLGGGAITITEDQDPENTNTWKRSGPLTINRAIWVNYHDRQEQRAWCRRLPSGPPPTSRARGLRLESDFLAAPLLAADSLRGPMCQRADSCASKCSLSHRRDSCFCRRYILIHTAAWYPEGKWLVPVAIWILTLFSLVGYFSWTARLQSFSKCLLDFGVKIPAWMLGALVFPGLPSWAEEAQPRGDLPGYWCNYGIRQVFWWQGREQNDCNPEAPPNNLDLFSGWVVVIRIIFFK